MGYTTATLIEAELRASTAFSATTLPTLSQVTTWIEEESADIDNELGYSIASTQYDEYYDFDSNHDTLFTAVAPIISVDTLLYATAPITSSDYSTSWETKTQGTHFYVKKDRGEILPIWSQWQPKSGEQRIRLIYTAGYATTPAVYQKLATKMVAARVLDSLIYNNVNDRNDGGSISVGSISIVEPGNYGVTSYERLLTDISDLKKKVTEGFGVHRYGYY